MYFPIAVATDIDGSVWSANQGDSTASLLSNNGSPLSASGGWGLSGGLAGPAAVAIDASHNAWFANQASDSVTSISHDGSQVTTILTSGDEPDGIATDSIGISTNSSKGHIWIANFSSGSISELELGNDGTVAVISSTGYTGGGLDTPAGIAVDGAGNVWVTNYHSGTRTHGATITELQGANAANPGQPLSPSSGFGLDANLLEPDGIAIDASGNVWVSNFGLSTITQFLGAATPVKTPLIDTAQLP